MGKVRLALRTSPLQPIEHKVWRQLKQHGVFQKRILLAFSGGVDSVALAILLYRLKPLHQCEIQIAHVHHGEATSAQIRKYRRQSVAWSQKFARSLGLEFLTNFKKTPGRKSTQKSYITSEADLRDFRYQWLQKWRVRWGNDNGSAVWLALGHHADDLLETQLIRLIRGVGPMGLESMSFCQGGSIRPMMAWRREDVESYARRFWGEWFEDPSNNDEAYLRNWLRHHWLKALDKRVPGGVQTLARSLRLIVESLKVTSIDQEQGGKDLKAQKHSRGARFDRRKFLALSSVEQRAWIARLLMGLKIKNYSFGHIEEICRQLDNRRENFTFTILKHEWHVNAGRVIIERN